MNDVVKPTQKELFNRYVNIYTEIDTLNDDIKQLNEEVKETCKKIHQEILDGKHGKGKIVN